MRPTSRMIAFTLFAIVTVEFGGWSLLGMLTSQGAITEFEEQFFRAGHAHAGVLLTLALIYFVLMDRTDFSPAPTAARADPAERDPPPIGWLLPPYARRRRRGVLAGTSSPASGQSSSPWP